MSFFPSRRTLSPSANRDRSGPIGCAVLLLGAKILWKNLPMLAIQLQRVRLKTQKMFEEMEVCGIDVRKNQRVDATCSILRGLRLATPDFWHVPRSCHCEDRNFQLPYIQLNRCVDPLSSALPPCDIARAVFAVTGRPRSRQNILPEPALRNWQAA